MSDGVLHGRTSAIEQVLANRRRFVDMLLNVLNETRSALLNQNRRAIRGSYFLKNNDNNNNNNSKPPSMAYAGHVVYAFNK